MNRTIILVALSLVLAGALPQATAAAEAQGGNPQPLAGQAASEDQAVPAGKPSEAPPVPPTPTVAAPSSASKPAADSFTIETASGDSRLRVGGYVQGDGRLFVDDGPKLGTNTLLLRRARPQLQGTLARRFDFSFMADFGGGSASVQDAYIDARFASYFRVRAGKFKSPVGLERLQSGANLLFVERALPTLLLPNRDIGLQIHGEVAAGVFAWALALQNGTADGGSVDGDSNDGKEISGRLFTQPFKKTKGPLRGLGLGISGQTGKEAAAPASYKTPGQLTFFSYATGVTVDGTRQRLSPQGYFYLGQFGVLGEYALSSSPLVKPDKDDPANARRGRVRNQSWQAAASFFLTGEKAAFSAVKPAKPFDPAKGQWGALELAARVHQLSVGARAFDVGLADPGKSARRATAWAVGLNWYLNRHVKYVLDYEQTSFEGGATDGDRPTERALLVRAQVLF